VPVLPILISANPSRVPRSSPSIAPPPIARLARPPFCALKGLLPKAFLCKYSS